MTSVDDAIESKTNKKFTFTVVIFFFMSYGKNKEEKKMITLLLK